MPDDATKSVEVGTVKILIGGKTNTFFSINNSTRLAHVQMTNNGRFRKVVDCLLVMATHLARNDG